MYIDIEYVKEQMPEELVNLFSNDSSESSNQKVISQLIEEVSNLIDSHIQSSGYDLDKVKENPPAMLRRIALDIFKFYLYSRKDIEDIEEVETRKLRAESKLERIRNGQLKLPGIDDGFNNRIFLI